MMSPSEIWLTIAFMGLVTYLPRLLPMLFLSRMTLPEWLKIWLRYVPTSIFGALIFSEIFFRNGVLDLSLKNPYLWASLVAFGVALKTRSLPGTIVAGGLLFWVFQNYLS